MNIKGIGVDIEEVKRFKRLPYKSNQSFYKKNFTSAEIDYCLSKTNPARHFAARFVGKESVLKCLESTIYKVSDIEISNKNNGAPTVKVKGKKGKFIISLSHTKDKAIAIALWLN